MPGWLHAYWSWAGSNIGAMPAEFIITVLATIVFRKAIRRGLNWLRRDAHAVMDKAQEDAQVARRIAADLYRHLTGEDHPAQNGG